MIVKLRGKTSEGKKFEREYNDNTVIIMLKEMNLSSLDLSPLEACAKLEHLTLYGNNFTFLDLSPLQHCPELRVLNLSNNDLSNLDLSPLKHCRKLKKLNLRGNKLDSLDISPLQYCSQLEQFQMDSNTKIQQPSNLQSWESIPDALYPHVRSFFSAQQILDMMTKEQEKRSKMLEERRTEARELEQRRKARKEQEEKLRREREELQAEKQREIAREVEAKKQKEAEEQRRREIDANPCQICNDEVAEHHCPDCDRKVGDSHWNIDMAICTACENKLRMISGQGTVTQHRTSPTTASLSENEVLIKLRNMLQMSEKVPIPVMAKALQFSNEAEFSGWLASLSLVGVRVDYTSDPNMLTVSDEEVFDQIDQLIELER